MIIIPVEPTSSARMCKSVNEAFSWIGAILVNLAFLSIIGYGAATLWPIGMVFCGLYTILLFRAARLTETPADLTSYFRIDTDEVSLDLATNTLTTVSAPDQGDGRPETAVSRRKLSLSSNLLYALAIVGMGATGSFPSFNLFKCKNHDWHTHGEYRYEWKTDLTTLPPGVRKWAAQANDATGRGVSSFAYLPETGTTLFSGSRDASTVYLFEVRTGSGPTNIHDCTNPVSFTVVTDESACFLCQFDQQVGCYMDGSFQLVDDRTNRGLPKDRVSSYSDLLALDGVLWYKGYSYEARGMSIQSYDLKLHERTDYSELNDINDSEHAEACDHPRENRRIALAALFTVAMPVTVGSIFLWIRRQVPSMGMTTVLGFNLLYLTISEALGNDDFIWLSRWNLSQGLFWLVILSYLHLARDFESHHWGLNVGGVLFLVGMIGVVFDGSEQLSDWVIFNVFCFIPLMILGMANNSMFLIVMAGIGWLVDAGRLTSYVSTHVSDSVSFLAGFLIFSFTGLLIAVVGLFLKRYQESFHIWIKASLKSLTGVPNNDLLQTSVSNQVSSSRHGEDYERDSSSM